MTTARANREPVVDHLTEVWNSLAGACESLADGQWALATDCPGWTVKDQLSHLIGVERMLLGDTSPPALRDVPDHVRNPIGEINEAWVEARRPVPGREVLTEFVETTNRRLVALREMPTAEFEVIGPSPVGEVPYRVFMETRVMDSWAHEQDVRRALGRPGGRNGAGEVVALDRTSAAMPYVVGKLVAPPDGTTVLFAVVGVLGRQLLVRMDGRRADAGTPSPDEDPTVSLGMDQETFLRLAFGRVAVSKVLASGEVRLDGDVALGHRVLDAMAFMI